MSLATYEQDMQRAIETCQGSNGIRCDLVREHAGAHWSGAAVSFLGIDGRCGEANATGHCWRFKGHVGPHEDANGKTYRKARAKR